MKKKHRNPKASQYDYKKHIGEWNGTPIHEESEEYYGIHRDGARVKIDIKRMKKIKSSGVPEEVLEAASNIPRNTTYFLPKKIHRDDYVCNQFRDKLTELARQWGEIKGAFSKILSPQDVEAQVRAERLADGIMEYEEADIAGKLAGIKRTSTYYKLWVSQCAQFIHQMAVELDALLLRKCVYLGFAEKEVTRGKMHTYLNGTMKGCARVEELAGYDIYTKFFTVWNMLKHNSEDLFDKLQKNYPDMLLTDHYRNGELSQYYLKIGNDYIESMFSDLVPFYENLCREFFGENPAEAKWNYDDYFVSIVKDTIEAITNPFDI